MGLVSYVLLAACSPLIAASIPALISKSSKELPTWVLLALLGISSGMLFAVATLDLIPEGIEIAVSQSEQEWNTEYLPVSLPPLEHSTEESYVKIATFGIFMGFLVMMIVEQTMSHFGAAHSHSHGSNDNHDLSGHSHDAPKAGILSSSFSIAALVGLAVHSFVDGVMIGGAFIASSSVGARVGIAIVLHKFPDGFMLSSILQTMAKPNASQRRAKYFFQQREFFWLIGIVAMTPLGALTSFNLLEGIPGAGLGFVLCFGAGTFLFIICSGVVPELLHADTPKFLTIGTFTFGYFAFLISDTFFHAH